jgi:hypothetical protein
VIRGNSDIHQSVPEDPRFGATRIEDRRRYRKAVNWGDLRIGKSAPPNDAHRGDSMIHRRSSRRCGARGNPSPSSQALQEKASDRGDSGTHRNQQRQRHATFEATRSAIAGTAEDPKPRGNPRIRTPAQQKGSGEGATWRRNPGRAGRSRKRGNLPPDREAERDDALIHRAKDHPESARGRKVSGVFDFGRKF